MNKQNLILLTLLFTLNVSAQVNYHVKLMSWNVLNWPSVSNFLSDTTERCPAYRTVVNFVKPDILITSENTTSNSIPLFLNQVMNTGSYHYQAGTFINGYDTDNGIFYRDSLFDFISNQPIQTFLRDINHFTLVFKLTGDTIHIFSCHLKAGQGYEPQRGSEIAKLRQVTNAFPAGTNFIIGGDFNIYEAAEPAYTGMLQDNPGDDGNFIDPIQLSGIWNYSGYAPYHTQSTHVNSTGTFAGGGMDDRFDMILFSNAIAEPTGVYYLPGTYLNLGNDGNHFNRDINFGTNTAVPIDVANALFNSSDHLPIIVTMSFGSTSGIKEAGFAFSDVNVFPDPVVENSKVYFTLKETSKVNYVLMDALGRIMDSSSPYIYEPGGHFLPVDWNKLNNSGVYFLSINYDNRLVIKKIIYFR